MANPRVSATTQMQPLTEEQASSLAATLKAVADPVRLRLINMLADGSEICACDFVAPLNVGQPTVSHHLKILHEAGIVARRREGRWMYYKLIPETLASIATAIHPEDS